MIELDNRTSLEVNETQLQTIADFLTHKDIELIVTDNTEMKEINFDQRGIDKDTDVLSFPCEEMEMFPLGSIVISSNHIVQKAQELGHETDDEFALLFIHGLLHLLGYDHEVDDGEMRAKEKELIKKFQLPSSLIIRTQG